MSDAKLNFEPTDTNVDNLESFDVAMTSEESLDMWPPIVPRKTQGMFFVATKDVQTELLHCEDLHSDGINYQHNIVFYFLLYTSNK